MFGWLASLLGRRAGLTVAMLVAATLLALSYAPHLRFDFTPQALFAGSDDLLERSESFKDTFGHDDATILVVLEAAAGAGEGDGVLAPAPLTWARDACWILEGTGLFAWTATLPDTEVPFTVKVRPLRLGMTPLVPMGPVDEAGLTRLRAAMRESAELESRFVSADRRLLASYVQLEPGDRSLEGMQRAIETIETVLAHHPPPEGFSVHLGGLPALRVTIVRDLQRDQLRLLPIAAALFVVLLVLLFRSLVWALVPLTAVGLGLGWTVGLIAGTGHPFNILSNILPLLLFILGTTNAVHIVARYGEEERADGVSRREAAHRTLTHLGLACLLTTLTTASGFFSLIISRTEALKDLAWQAAAGVFLIYVATFALLSATIWWFQGPFHERRMTWIQRGLAHLAGLVTRRPIHCVVVSLAAIAASLLLARTVAVDSYMLETYDDEHETTRLVRDIEERLGGYLSLDIRLEGKDASVFADPEVYRRIHALSALALKERAVLGATSYVTVLDAIRRGPLAPAGGEEVRAGEASAEGIRDALEACGPIARDLGLTRYLTPDRTQARVQLRVRDIGTRRTLALLARLETAIDGLFPEGAAVTAELTGDATINAYAMDRFVRDLFSSLLFATVLVFGLMGLLFWSLRAGLIAVLPNLTPLVITLGYMGIRGYDMTVGNAIVFTISLGVAVDNTVHLLARTYEELGHGLPIEEAVRRAMVGTGRAMVFTTVLLIVGLSALWTSDFVPNRRFAELTSLTMASALVGDLVLLPASLRLFLRPRRTG